MIGFILAAALAGSVQHIPAKEWLTCKKPNSCTGAGVRGGLRGAAEMIGVKRLCLIGCAVFWSAVACAAAHADPLTDVNFRENHDIRPGHATDFTPHLAVGDCKTYAASKRADLQALGYAPERLAIWYVITPWKESHAVLVVDNATVLDNLNRWPIPLSDARKIYDFRVELPESLTQPNRP